LFILIPIIYSFYLFIIFYAVVAASFYEKVPLMGRNS